MQTVSNKNSAKLMLTPLVGIALCLCASAQSRIFHFTGTKTLEKLGTDIDATSDIDGDGVLDIIIGNPGFSQAGFGTGGAAVYSGATGVKLFQFSSSQSTSQFGQSVAAAGDVDGDGFGDILVGDAWHELSPGVRRGRATLFRGSNGSVLATFDGSLPNDSFSNSMTGLGDIDGDSLDDFAIAAFSADTGGQNAGAVSVYKGTTGSLLYTISGPSVGLALGTDFGSAIANVGDLNDDGLNDFAVGAPRDSSNNLWAGRVFVFSSSGALLWQVPAVLAQGFFGTSVAAAGDVNGDGVPDVIVGAPQPPSGPGYTLVLSGIDGSILHGIAGNQPFVQSGISVSSAGDFNNDGKSEFAVGRFGFGEGVKVFDGATATELFDLSGSSQFGIGGYGNALDLADINADGQPDLVIGGPGLTTGALNSHGEVDVISMKTMALAASAHLVSLQAGGTVDLVLEAGTTSANDIYWILGSLSGSTPGFPINGLLLPLVPDAYFNFTVTQVNSAFLPASLSTLDAGGSATTTLQIPSAASPALAGLTVRHAFTVLDSVNFAFTFTSNAVGVLLQP